MRDGRRLLRVPARRATAARLGPLVGYAGRDAAGRQYVGRRLRQLRPGRAPAGAAARSSPAGSTELRGRAASTLRSTAQGFCGAPEGGKAFAYQLALEPERELHLPGEEVTAVAATPRARETSDLVFSRHEPEAGESWFIVEDVCNNFSTTARWWR